MEDKKKKLKWSLNFFDLVIIAVAVVACFIIIRMAGSGNVIAPSGETKTVRYTVELSTMLDDVADMIKPGDALIDKIEKRPVGTVVSVEVTPAYVSAQSSVTGDYIITEIPEHKSAIVVLEAVCNVSDFEISTSVFAIRTGTKISFTGPGYSGSGFIIEIARDGV